MHPDPSQIAQIAAKLGHPNPFVENNIEALTDFCRDVERRINDEYKYRQRQISELTSILAERTELEDEANVLRKWETYLWYFEVLLVAWGAVQIAHGEEIVLLLQTLEWSLF